MTFWEVEVCWRSDCTISLVDSPRSSKYKGHETRQISNLCEADTGDGYVPVQDEQIKP